MRTFALSVIGILLILLGTIASAHSNPKLQTKLPSKVKQTKIVKSTAKKQKPAELTMLVAEIDKGGLSPYDDKYVSKTVHFAASASPVPHEYDCDTQIEEKQMRQAENDAMAKCEARGEEHCRLHQISIVKKGDLLCEEIPGRNCSQRKFYRGCVAQAIVVGGEEPEAQASVF